MDGRTDEQTHDDSIYCASHSDINNRSTTSTDFILSTSFTIYRIYKIYMFALSNKLSFHKLMSHFINTNSLFSTFVVIGPLLQASKEANKQTSRILLFVIE